MASSFMRRDRASDAREREQLSSGS